MTDEPEAPKVAAVAALIQELRRVLLRPYRDVVTLQAEFDVALVRMGQFLAAQGEEDLALKFIGLGDAIGGLANGTDAQVLRRARVGGRGPDGIVLWSLRHEVVKALFLISGKMKTAKDAAKYIVDNYPVFDRLKRNPKDSLATSILSWRQRINKGDVPEEAEDVLAHQRSFFEQYGGENRSPAEKFELGKQLLAQAAERTTKAVF